MKKLALIMILLTFSVICVSCGPYGDYAGTYTSSSSSVEFVVTLSASGKFRFERKFKVNDQYSPDKSSNIREGTFTIEDGVISISITYYDPALRQDVTERATGRKSGNKLIITGSDEIGGTFIKK